MGRMIDGDALIEKIEYESSADGAYGYMDTKSIVDCINDAPTIEERKTGTWEIYVISPFDGEGCQCSECKYEGAPYWDFCPNCGAEMSEGEYSDE